MKSNLYAALDPGLEVLQFGKCHRLWTGRLAQPVRAPALQAGGPRFEPATAHQTLQGDTTFPTGLYANNGGKPRSQTDSKNTAA